MDRKSKINNLIKNVSELIESMELDEKVDSLNMIKRNSILSARLKMNLLIA